MYHNPSKESHRGKNTAHLKRKVLGDIFATLVRAVTKTQGEELTVKQSVSS